MVTKRRSAVDGVFATTTDLINYAGTWYAGEIVETDGYAASGDGGGAKWKLTGNTIAASQTPALTGKATLSDANGNEFELSEFIHRDVALGAEGLIPFNAFQETDPQTNTAKNILVETDTGSHSGEARSANAIQFNPVGSGANGPTNADIGHAITVIKKNWTNQSTVADGEIDGLQIVTRNGGNIANKNDSNGIMVNSQCIDSSGFVAAAEMEASTIDKDTFQFVRKARFQAVPLDEETLNVVGAFVMQNGDFDDFIRFQQSAGTNVDFLLKHVDSVGTRFAIQGDGKIRLYQANSSDYITLAPNGNRFEIQNSAGTAKVFFDVVANDSLFNIRARFGGGVVAIPSAFQPANITAGMIATDDGTNWSGVNATGNPRPVFYDGTSWIAMT